MQMNNNDVYFVETILMKEIFPLYIKLVKNIFETILILEINSNLN